MSRLSKPQLSKSQMQELRRLNNGDSISSRQFDSLCKKQVVGAEMRITVKGGVAKFQEKFWITAAGRIALAEADCAQAHASTDGGE